MNEYSRISDELYSLNANSRLVFHSSVTWVDDYGTKSHYNEYKTSNRNDASVVIKRKISYFLTFEYSLKGGDKASVMIYPDQMFEVLEKFNYIKNTWFNKSNNYNIFGLMGDKLVVLNSMEKIKIHCPSDKILQLEPTIKRDENGDRIAALMYIVNSTYPIILTPEKFDGLLYILSTLDMATYANTTLSMVALREHPSNRTDFSSGNIDPTQNTSVGKSGRDFKYRQSIL